MAKTYYFRRDDSCDGAAYVVQTTCPESYVGRSGYTALSQKAGKAAYAEQQKAALRADILSGADSVIVGDTGRRKIKVYYVLRSCSASGMERVFDFYVVKNNDIQCITYNVSQSVPSFKLAKDRGLVVRGCGMDMAHHVIYSLWIALDLPGVVGYTLYTL
jgi:hypothetical protein